MLLLGKSHLKCATVTYWQSTADVTQNVKCATKWKTLRYKRYPSAAQNMAFHTAICGLRRCRRPPKRPHLRLFRMRIGTITHGNKPHSTPFEAANSCRRKLLGHSARTFMKWHFAIIEANNDNTMTSTQVQKNKELTKINIQNSSIKRQKSLYLPEKMLAYKNSTLCAEIS